MPWHSLTTQEIFKELKTSERGLDAHEANKRLAKFGYNTLPEKKRFSALELLLRQLKSPLIYLLFAAAGISLLLNDLADGYIILLAALLAVVFGYFQEQKAEDTLNKLEKMIKLTANVLRDGKIQEIDAVYTVPGDILMFSSGDKIPADVRLISGKNLEMQEAALTGESYPVTKNYDLPEKGAQISDQTNMAFMGTVVSRGRGHGVVVETGLGTQFGKIAASLGEVKEELTPFQKKIEEFAKTISLIIFVIVLGVFAGGVYRNIEFSELFNASVAVAVAAVPENLIIAITVILSIGMTRLLKKQALVRKLISAETLGSTTVICSDKTGTLTEGDMRVSEILVDVDLTNESIRDIGAKSFALEISAIANEAYIENPKDDVSNWKLHGDPTETALIRACIESGLADRILKLEEDKIDEMPFESENQYMATLLTQGNPKPQILNSKSKTVYYKGAPEKLLGASTYIYDPAGKDRKKQLYESHLEKLENQYKELSKKGLRVLAVCFKEAPDEIQADGKKIKIEKLSQIPDLLSELIFVGFIALKDPLRDSAKDTIKIAEDAGIRVVMITGDNIFTAKSVAAELGLPADKENIIEGKDLNRIDDNELEKRVTKISVYARILPQDKLRIVNAFQARGEVVAMTGDGVNDAPALKKADIGVAMGEGTEVAKETSDIVILDNNFKTIVAAVEEGRVIFDNLKKVIVYLLSDSFSEIILVAGSIISGLPLAVSASQILWVNLVEDGLPAFALAYEPTEKDIMKIPPQRKNAPILDRQMKVIIFVIGIINSLLLFGVFHWLYSRTGNVDYARTMTFVALGLNSLIYIFSIKSLRHPIFNINLFSNRYLVSSVVFGFFMLLIAVYVPFMQKFLHTVALVHVTDWLIIIAVSSFSIIGIEIAKFLFARRG